MASRQTSLGAKGALHFRSWPLIAGLLLLTSAVYSAAPQSGRERRLQFPQNPSATTFYPSSTGRRLLTSFSPQPEREAAVLFVDSGVVAYFYAIDLRSPEQPIVDALHVYDVPEFEARDTAVSVRIVWSRDGNATAFLVNEHARAVFDFAKQRGFARSGLPERTLQWSQSTHQWDEIALDPFRY